MKKAEAIAGCVDPKKAIKIKATAIKPNVPIKTAFGRFAKKGVVAGRTPIRKKT